jgi:hypothetical protein
MSQTTAPCVTTRNAPTSRTWYSYSSSSRRTRLRLERLNGTASWLTDVPPLHRPAISGRYTANDDSRGARCSSIPICCAAVRTFPRARVRSFSEARRSSPQHHYRQASSATLTRRTGFTAQSVERTRHIPPLCRLIARSSTCWLRKQTRQLPTSRDRMRQANRRSTRQECESPDRE